MTEKRRKSERINIRIEPELKAQFEKYLEETGRTMSWLVTRWIREELERWKEVRRRES
jgi:antitoxin component of RelBE/YafQ-DinJ toxin-antitoxin module